MPDANIAKVEAFFDSGTSTISYVLWEIDGGQCAIVDSVMDYDPKAGVLSTRSAQRIIDFVRAHCLVVEWLLESHAHADHLSAAPYLKSLLGGKIAIGEGIRAVQGTFGKVFNFEPDFRFDGSQFDHLFSADELFFVGSLAMRAMPVPGHTPADIAYVHERRDRTPVFAFVGDTLFMPDIGSARCDFPGGDAHALYRSVRALLALPPTTRLYMCHDYPPAGREACWETSVAEQRALNIHFNDGVSECAFVEMRQKRDATLSAPTLILPAIQVNVRAGELPPAEDNGVGYMKIPLTGL